jgi:hypothetical protein
MPEKGAKLGARRGEQWRLTVGQFGRRVRRWRCSRGAAFVRQRAEEGRGEEIRNGGVGAERRRLRRAGRALAGATGGQMATASGACRPRGARRLRGRVRVAARAGERPRRAGERASARSAGPGRLRSLGRKWGGGPIRLKK